MGSQDKGGLSQRGAKVREVCKSSDSVTVGAFLYWSQCKKSAC